MLSRSGLTRISTALAVALALVPLLASGSAAAATSKPTEVPQVDRPIDVIDSDEIGDPVDHPIDVIDSDEIGDPVDEGSSDSDEDLDADPELPTDTEETGGGSGGAAASVRDVPLARTGFSVLLLASLGGVSLVTGLCLVGLRRV
ncbi:MAG: hypothetical protein H0X55_05985 [Thermoleophilaceae bacterium]|jgi:hypothetical protein|nr:hypothetical protein [Thermoleophilaceae bacterium]